jgi:hypothetical protein
MNDDYLWDRTGEPDPEIQQLEELLGTLRYQPQPLELPSGVRPERRRRFLPPLAIAATIALMMLAAGVWVRFHRGQAPASVVTAGGPPAVSGEKNNPGSVVAPPTSGGGNQQLASGPGNRAGDVIGIGTNHRPVAPRHPFAKDANRHGGAVEPHSDLTAEQRDQAIAAKGQLMLALRVASAKLNFAQRKTQGPPAPSTIRNQHKNG